jgi:hypothetical protein
VFGWQNKGKRPVYVRQLVNRRAQPNYYGPTQTDKTKQLMTAISLYLKSKQKRFTQADVSLIDVDEDPTKQNYYYYYNNVSEPLGPPVKPVGSCCEADCTPGVLVQRRILRTRIRTSSQTTRSCGSPPTASGSRWRTAWTSCGMTR